MTHLRTFPAVDQNKRPALGQGFTTLTETLLEEVETTESIQGKSHAYAEDVIVREITTEQMRAHQSSLSLSLGVHASFVLSVLGEFSQHQEETSQAIESFLVMIMPLRTDTVDVAKWRGALPDLKDTPVDRFFSRAGDRYVKSITYGNYFLADMALIKGEQKKEKSGNFNASGTEPTTGIGGKAKAQASQVDKKSFSKDQKFMQSNRPELLVPKEGGGYDLDKTKEAFKKDAEHSRQAQRDNKDYLLPAMSFEVSEYDQKAESHYDAYVTMLKACHEDVRNALFYIDSHLEALDFFDQSSEPWPVKVSKEKQKGFHEKHVRLIDEEKYATSKARKCFEEARATLVAYQTELEKKSPPTPERLKAITKEVGKEITAFIRQKEQTKVATHRLKQVVTLEAQESKVALPSDWLSPSLKENIRYCYIEMEGREAKAATVNVYHKHYKQHDRCLTIQGDRTYLEASYLAIEKTPLCFGISEKEDTRFAQSPAIHLKIYAVHPHFRETPDIAISEEVYFRDKIKPKLPKQLGRLIQTSRLEEGLEKWKAKWEKMALKAEIARLPKEPFKSVRRKEEMQQLQTSTLPLQVLHGMGGVGKSYLATDYVYQIQDQFEFVRWVYADPQRLTEEWMALGALLEVNFKEHRKDVEEKEKQRLIREALERKPSWLLILDNLESQDALEGLLPERLTERQRVLITSHNPDWRRANVIALRPFELDQCEAYVKDRLPDRWQQEGIEELTTCLYGLPLALSHAVAYMKKNKKSAKEYSDLYKAQRFKLFEKSEDNESKALGYDRTIATTWLLSIEQLEKENPTAGRLVRVCGYLQADAIPDSLLQAALQLDEMELDSSVGEAQKYALLTRENGYFKIHRLVQEAICYHEQSSLKEKLFLERLKPLTDTLYELYPFEKAAVEDYTKARQLQPHLERVLAHLIETAGSLADDKEQTRALEICQANTQAALGDLFLNVLGNAKEALTCLEQALAIHLKVYGEEHPDVAMSYNNLGEIYRALGNAKEALKCQKKALAIYLKVYGEEHPHVATSYGNLGNIYLDLSDVKEALKCQEKALAIKLKIYGEEHPDVATSYNNLDGIYSALGNAQEALKCQEKALAIKLKIYGEEHPAVATSYANLGGIYSALGDAKEALKCEEKALAIYLKVYGEEHPTVAMSYNSLGEIHRALGNAKEALKYQEKALAIKLKIYGEEHPSVATSYNNLDVIYSALGNTKEALKYQEKALAIHLKVYGEEHPTVATSYNNLGGIHLDLGDAKEALKYQQKALAILLKVYGEEHPDVATSYNNLGSTHHALGDAKEALKCQEKALAILLKVYGEEHPYVATSYSNLGSAHEALGDAKKALEYYEKALVLYQQLGKEQKMRQMALRIERLKAQIAILIPPAPVLLPPPVSPRPPTPVPTPRPQPASTTFSPYVSFFRSNPGKAALLVGGSAVVVGALAYTYFKKPGGGAK